jgi:hypothetical protein
VPAADIIMAQVVCSITDSPTDVTSTAPNRPTIAVVSTPPATKQIISPTSGQDNFNIRPIIYFVVLLGA